MQTAPSNANRNTAPATKRNMQIVTWSVSQVVAPYCRLNRNPVSAPITNGAPKKRAKLYRSLNTTPNTTITIPSTTPALMPRRALGSRRPPGLLASLSFAAPSELGIRQSAAITT